MIQALLTGSIATLFGAGLVLAVVWTGMFAWSARHKISAALRGSPEGERDQAA